MTMIKHQATPANVEQGMNNKTTPESGERNAENNEKEDKVEERKPRRSSRSPVAKKNPEDDKNLDPVTKLILAKKITEFSAEHGRDPDKDEIEQMFEETIRVLGGELVDESYVCDHASELQEDAEDFVDTALPIELADVSAMPNDAEELKKRKPDSSIEDVKAVEKQKTNEAEAVEKQKTNEAEPTAISPPSQPANDKNAEDEPEAMSAKPESMETGQAKPAQEVEDEKNPPEINSETAQPEATEVNSEEKVSVPNETKEQSSPKKEEQPSVQDEMAVDDAAEQSGLAVPTETKDQSSPKKAEQPPAQDKIAVHDSAEQSGLKKRKRDISTEDVEAMKKLKTNMAMEP